MNALAQLESTLITAKPGAARPYKTLYYATNRGAGWESHGSAASEKGAIRAAVVRVFEKQFQRAEIYEAGVLIYTIQRTIKGINIGFGSAV